MTIFRKVWRKALQVFSRIAVPRSGRRLRHVRGPGYEMLVFANEDVGRQIWLFGSYEPDETRFFRDSIRTNDVCLDIGGNVGYFSLLMSRAATSGAVHVFEPIPLNAAMVRVNADLNALSNVTVNNVAVGSSEGMVQFSVSVDSAYSSMRATGRLAEERMIDVPIITLDDYVERAGIARVDVMKVDVEGAEDMVISGGSRLLSDEKRRPRIVLLELYDGNLSHFGTCVGAVVAHMTAFGYSPKVLADAGEHLIPYSPDMANKTYNIIFVLA